MVYLALVLRVHKRSGRAELRTVYSAVHLAKLHYILSTRFASRVGFLPGKCLQQYVFECTKYEACMPTLILVRNFVRVLSREKEWERNALKRA